MSVTLSNLRATPFGVHVAGGQALVLQWGGSGQLTVAAPTVTIGGASAPVLFFYASDGAALVRVPAGTLGAASVKVTHADIVGGYYEQAAVVTYVAAVKRFYFAVASSSNWFPIHPGAASSTGKVVGRDLATPIYTATKVGAASIASGSANGCSQAGLLLPETLPASETASGGLVNTGGSGGSYSYYAEASGPYLMHQALTYPFWGARAIPAGNWTFRGLSRGFSGTGSQADQLCIFIRHLDGTVTTVLDTSTATTRRTAAAIADSAARVIAYTIAVPAVTLIDGDQLGVEMWGRNYSASANQWTYHPIAGTDSPDLSGYTDGQSAGTFTSSGPNPGAPYIEIPTDLFALPTDGVGASAWAPTGATTDSGDHVIEDGSTGPHAISNAASDFDDVSRTDLSFTVDLLDATHDWVKIAIGDEWGFLQLRTKTLGDHSAGFMVHGAAVVASQTSLIASWGTIASANSNASQRKLIWDGTHWWAFYFRSGNTSTLFYSYSTDLVTWVESSVTGLGNGYALDLFGGTIDALWDVATGVVLISYSSAAWHGFAYVRGVVSGTTITWGNKAVYVLNSSKNASADYDMVMAKGSDNKIRYMTDSGGGNWWVYTSTNTLSTTFADTAANWSYAQLTTITGYPHKDVLYDRASGAFTKIGTDGTSGTCNLTAWVHNGVSWGSSVTVSAMVAGDYFSWGSAKVSDASIWVLARSATSTWVLKQTTDGGANWTTKTAPTWPTGNLATNSQVSIATDGTNVWAIVIRGDTNKSVSYNKYTVAGDSWGGWTDLEASAATRTNVAAMIANGLLVATWSQTNGSNYDVYNAYVSI